MWNYIEDTKTIKSKWYLDFEIIKEWKVRKVLKIVEKEEER